MSTAVAFSTLEFFGCNFSALERRHPSMKRSLHGEKFGCWWAASTKQIQFPLSSLFLNPPHSYNDTMFGAINRFAIQRPVIFWSFVLGTAGKEEAKAIFFSV